MERMMYNPCNPGELLREYPDSMPVGEAALLPAAQVSA